MAQKSDNLQTMNEVDRVRKELHASICREWEETAPDAVREGTAPTRVIAVIASRHGMTSQGVERILRSEGYYDGAKKYKQTVNEGAEQ